MVSLNLKDVLQQNILAVSASLFAIYILMLVFWRLFLHPLAKYPGPKLAALTQSYEFYYDGIKQGRYTFEIGRMHQKYGLCSKGATFAWLNTSLNMATFRANCTHRPKRAPCQ